MIRRPNGLKLYGNILALPGNILKISGVIPALKIFIGRSQNIKLWSWKYVRDEGNRGYTLAKHGRCGGPTGVAQGGRHQSLSSLSSKRHLRQVSTI